MMSSSVQTKRIIPQSSYQDTDISNGNIRPNLVTSEQPQSSLLLLDSKDSNDYNTNPFNFVCNIGRPLFRVRQAQLVKVNLPKMNNICINNNIVTLEHSVDGLVSFTLFPGLYAPSSFINEFVSKANAVLTTVTISGSYSQPTRQFTFTISSGLFMFENTCSFIIRGYFFAPFSSFPSGTVGVNGATSNVSGIASLLYTRYITVNSAAICRYELVPSDSTDPTQPDNTVALIDVSSMYSAADFDVGVQFSSNIASIDVPYGARINVLNSQKNFGSELDIFCLDEWNLDLKDAYDMQDGTINRMGITVFINFFF